MLMALLSLFFANVLAMGVQAELVVDDVKVKDDKEKIQSAPDGVKDILSSVDLKKDIAKIHNHEIAVQNIRPKVSPDEFAVDDSSISRPIFRQQENINKPTQFSFFVPDFSDADFIRGRGAITTPMMYFPLKNSWMKYGVVLGKEYIAN